MRFHLMSPHSETVTSIPTLIDPPRTIGHSADMPELPEVETVCRGLAQVLEGRRLVSVRVMRPDLRIPFPDRHFHPHAY